MQITKGRTTPDRQISVGFGEERMWKIGSIVGLGCIQHRRGAREEEEEEEEGATVGSTPFPPGYLEGDQQEGQPPVNTAPNFAIVMVAS
eukprot:796101-Amphidinium_carterae.1